MRTAGLRVFFLLCAVLAAPRAAGPAPVQELGVRSRTGVSLTVYEADLALVRERHQIELPAGETTVRLAPAPEGLDSHSVQVELAGAAGAELLEQDLGGNLISPDSILEQYLGREIVLVRVDEAGVEHRQQATLLSTNGGMVVRIGDEIALHPDGRVVVPALPDGLLPRPVLDWRVRARRAGASSIDLRYLTRGLSWSADHVATLRADTGKMDLSTWVTVANQTGVTYPDARLELVAGDLQRAGRGGPSPRLMRGQAMETMAPEPGFQQEPLFEYHLYALDRPVTLAGRGEKQIELQRGAGIPVTRRYVAGGNVPFGIGPALSGSPQAIPVEVRVEFRNGGKGGPGSPLPAGIVHLYQEAADGGIRFLGEDRIPHTPVNEDLSLVAGRAFDLVADRIQTDYQERSARPRRSYEAAFRISLRNRGAETRQVEVRESIPGDWTVLESSHTPLRPAASTLQFDVEVPAGGEVMVTYRFLVGQG